MDEKWWIGNSDTDPLESITKYTCYICKKDFDSETKPALVETAVNGARGYICKGCENDQAT